MEIALTAVVNQFPVIRIIGNPEKNISNVVSINKGMLQDGDMSWISDKNMEALYGFQNGVLICSSNVQADRVKAGCTCLVVQNPRLYFLRVVRTFFKIVESPSISDRSIIHPTVKIGRNATIHAGVVLEAHCEIGDDCYIDSNSVIKAGTIVGYGVKIGANNTIGGDGFGYEKNESGEYEAIPHIGNVIIEDHVEIGNNTTIDRAVLGSTIIRKNVKIDNLVHIAHGVEIGENSIIIANAMIAGSVTIGKNVWVAPSASILNKLEVGDEAVVGMGAVVLKNVSGKQTMVGNPAKDISSLKK